MSTLAVSWFEDDPRDLRRWTVAAAVVLGIHAALIGGYAVWQQLHPNDIGDESSPIAIELAPDDSLIDQPEVAPQPDTPPPPAVEQKPIEQPPPPPVVSSDVAALPEQQPIEETQKPPPPPPPPPMRARTKGGAPRIERSWETNLVKHLQAYKRYPSEAQSRGEQGVVLLGFSVDRNGHVLSRHIVHGSGHADLDAEVMAMIERAQPLPPFPASMTQAKLDFTVPIRFSLR
ncbi:MAG TPA: energy transducer TonB [Xanthobacteraceae bacterium]|jgi:protein TonB